MDDLKMALAHTGKDLKVSFYGDNEGVMEYHVLLTKADAKRLLPRLLAMVGGKLPPLKAKAKKTKSAKKKVRHSATLAQGRDGKFRGKTS